MDRVVLDEGPAGRIPAAQRRGSGLVREPELAELRAFCAAARLGSIAEAARSLTVSQPALSKRLRTLETVLGVELFQRSTRGVTLTAAGAHLYGAARRLLDSADTVVALMGRPEDAAPVRLGCSATVAEHRLPEVLAELAVLEPELAIELVSANSPLIRGLVRDGGLDLGIAAVDPDGPTLDGVAEKVIWRDELVLAVPVGHPWAALAEIPAAEFAGTSLISLDPWSNSSRVVAAALQRAGLTGERPYAAVGSITAVLAIAQATGRPALVPRMVALDREREQRGFVTRRVDGMRFDREFALIWPGQIAELPAAVQGVAQYILDLPFARSRRAGREFVAH